jgi:hypothetical protein
MTEPALAKHLGYPEGGLQEHYPGTTVRNHEWRDRVTFADVGTITGDRIGELSGEVPLNRGQSVGPRVRLACSF